MQSSSGTSCSRTSYIEDSRARGLMPKTSAGVALRDPGRGRACGSPGRPGRRPGSPPSWSCPRRPSGWPRDHPWKRAHMRAGARHGWSSSRFGRLVGTGCRRRPGRPVGRSADPDSGRYGEMSSSAGMDGHTRLAAGAGCGCPRARAPRVGPGRRLRIDLTPIPCWRRPRALSLRRPWPTHPHWSRVRSSTPQAVPARLVGAAEPLRLASLVDPPRPEEVTGSSFLVRHPRSRPEGHGSLDPGKSDRILCAVPIDRRGA